ncbi:hypothetical protein ACU8MP_16480 [Rhizobium leguminosarum]
MKRLVADLERLNAGGVSAPDLMAEPVLNNWLHGVRIVSCLEGTVEGHSAHSDEREIKTGELFAVFQDDGEVFARTLDGWYRLGSAREGTEQ